MRTHGLAARACAGQARSIRRCPVSRASRASAAQSDGVREVHEAVPLIDEDTPRNAALVERSAAAAESLHQQAQKLVQVVAVFKLA